MFDLTGLAIAAALFVGTHFLMSHPLRGPLVARVGESGFLGLYSAVSFVFFGWLALAAWWGGDGPLWWVAGEGLWAVATLVMLAASILLAGSFAGNPALPDPTGRVRAPEHPRGMLAVTRHPMLWSFTLWAAVHMLVWGSARNLIIAGGMGLLSLVGAAAQDAKKARLTGDAWRAWQARTAFWPFAAQLSGRLPWRSVWPGWRVLAGGIALWLVATWAHGPLGAPAAGLWRWLG